MEKLNRGITLVALVITIILLLILAGISLGMATGENGLIEKAKLSISSYKQSQSDEEKKIDLLSHMLDPNSINSDSGNVGINCNCEDKLKEINERIDNIQTGSISDEKLEALEKRVLNIENNTSYNLENCKPILLANLENTTKYNSTVYMDSYTRKENNNTNNYIQYDSISKGYRVLKSAWYFITISSLSFDYENQGECHTSTVVSIDGNEIFGATGHCWGGADADSGNISIYLSKDSVITCRKSVYHPEMLNVSQSYLSFYVFAK